MASVPLLRTSERKDFRRCPQRWEWRWVRGLKPDREKNALWFGTGMHKAMEAHYLLGRNRGGQEAAEAAWRAYCEGEWRKVWPQAEGPEEEEPMQALELGLIMLIGYFNMYGNDSQWEVLGTETPFQIRVPYPTSNRTLVWYAGTYDTIVRDLITGKLWLVDHKNVKSIDTGYLTMDDQAGSYLWVATLTLRHLGLIGPEEELEGIIFNFLRKGKPDNRPTDERGMYLNQNGTVSKKQPPPLFHREEVYRSLTQGVSQAKRVQQEATVMNGMRRGKLPLYKNPTKDCSWDCPFFELCDLDENGGDTEEFIQGVFRKDNPYADHQRDMARNGIVLR